MKNLKIRLTLSGKEKQEIHKILTASIRNRVEKARMEGAVVALSGGIDSSLVLKLTVEALGKDRVFALLLPERGVTPDRDLQDARNLVQSLGVPHREIAINEAVEWFSAFLPGPPENGAHRMALANVKPRIRMILVYFFANKDNRLVVGTSNKTELLLGYGTKYGDMAADIYPIGDLYKTQVWEMAEYVGIPTEIIQKAPTAGLWVGQTDEDELGHTYREIDQVLYALVDLELSVGETANLLNISRDAVEDLYRRIQRSEHKRKIPTITRISAMCLDKDWRYPVERF